MAWSKMRRSQPLTLAPMISRCSSSTHLQKLLRRHRLQHRRLRYVPPPPARIYSAFSCPKSISHNTSHSSATWALLRLWTRKTHVKKISQRCTVACYLAPCKLVAISLERARSRLTCACKQAGMKHVEIRRTMRCISESIDAMPPTPAENRSPKGFTGRPQQDEPLAGLDLAVSQL